MQDPAQNPYLATEDPSLAVAKIPGGVTTVGGASRTGMIITFALISGVVMISGVMLYLLLPDFAEDQALVRFGEEDLLYLIVGAVLCFGGLVMSFGLRSVLLGKAMSELNASSEDLPQPIRAETELPASGQAFLGSVLSATIVGQALMEGPAVTNAILLMLGGNLAHLILIGISTVGIAAFAPTPGRLIAMMEKTR